jgi:hypothetical protein
LRSLFGRTNSVPVTFAHLNRDGRLDAHVPGSSWLEESGMVSKL